MYQLIKKPVRRWRMMKAAYYARGRTLDIGCGQAELKGYLPSDCFYTGVDLRLNGLRGSSLIQLDVESSQREVIGEQYDTITALAVIEHLKDPQEVLHWCYERLNKRGRLVVTTPTTMGDFIVGKVFRLNVGHIKIFNERMLYEYFKKAGFFVKYYSKFEFGANQIIVGVK